MDKNIAINDARSMELPQDLDAPLGLGESKPHHYYGVYMHTKPGLTVYGTWDGQGDGLVGWVVACTSRRAAEIWLVQDAEGEGLPTDMYSILPITLAMAFEWARDHPLPAYFPSGRVARRIDGVVLVGNLGQTCKFEQFIRK